MPATLKQLAAQLLRAETSVWDFADAMAYLLEHRKLAADLVPLRRATLLAAIVAYARPFIQSETGPNDEMTAQVALSPSKLLGPEGLALHERAIALRNEALAHSDYSREQPQVVVMNATGVSTMRYGFELLDAIEPSRLGPVIETMFYAAQEKAAELRDLIKLAHQ